MILIEIAACNGDASLEIAKAHPRLTRERIAKDSDGLDRVLIAEKA